MKNVLRITSSLFAEDSVTSLLMEELLMGFRANGEEFQIQERNFRQQPVPHLDGEWLQALSTPAADRSDEQQGKVDYSDALVAELQSADSIVIGLPMYNFSVPSMLKAWIDHVARAGVTFKYTESGPVGLLPGKRVYLVAAMGGLHQAGQTDFLRPYMKSIMGFIGLDDVEFISAEGLAMGDEARKNGLAKARSQIAKLVGAQRFAEDLTSIEEEAA